MSSIPLIALSVKPPEVPDLVGNYARLQALAQQARMAPLQQQQAQQTVQQGQMEITDRQRQQESQQTIMDALSQSGDDLGKAIPIAAKSGKVLPADLFKLQQAHQTTQKQAIDLFNARGDAAVKESDMFDGAIDRVKAAPPEMRPQVYAQQLGQLQQLGVDVSQAPPQYPGDQALPSLSIAAKSHKAAMDQVLAQAKQAEVERHNQALEANTAAQQANTNAYRQAELKQGSQRIGMEAAKLAFEKAKSGITPAGQPDANAQAIASGHIVPERMSYLLARNPGIIDAVMQLDPTFDSSKAQSYPATYKDFTSGKTSIALNSGGTALTHLKELNDMNTVESHIPGTPDYNAYQNKADTVASELAKFYGDATIPAIASIKKTLTAQLPGNRKAAIQTQAQSMGDKLDSFAQQWQNAAPSKAYQAPMPGISPKAIAARAALDPKFAAQQQGTGAPQVPAGATHIVPGSDGHNHYTDGQHDLGIAP